MERISLLIALGIFYSLIQVVVHFAAITPNYSYLHYASYFTNQSNFGFACFLLYTRSRSCRLSDRGYDLVRAALTLYLFFTTSVYWPLLHRYMPLDFGITYLCNVYLHSVGFAFLLYDYWTRPPRWQVRAPEILLWLIFPAIYGAYIMALGAYDGWYPYPFLDPKTLGSMSKVYLSMVYLTIGFLSFAWILRFLHNKRIGRNTSV